MAPSGWKDLPADILSIIAEINYCDIHRLRFVCTSWRASLPPPPQKPKPFSFPLQVPANGLCDYIPTDYLNLRENTLYCFSSLASHPQSGDSSNGWMIKVTETSSNPKVFALLQPLSPKKMYYPPSTIPECLNLLDYRISEVCKSYSHDSSIHKYSGMPSKIYKVIALWNYLADCHFAILSLPRLGRLGEVKCWKFGGESWTLVDTIGHKIDDLFFFDGKCYAVDRFGVLICFDPNLTPTVVATYCPHIPFKQCYSIAHRNHLLECKSDLYLLSRLQYYPGPGGDVSNTNMYLVMGKFNKCNGNWHCVGDFGENVLLLGEDVSVGVSAKDFQGFQANCIYLTEPLYWKTKKYLEDNDGERKMYGDMAGLYCLDDPTKLRIKVHKEFSKLNWRPPIWLMPFASSLEP